MNRKMMAAGMAGVIGMMGSVASAQVSDYEELAEGFYGAEFYYNGVTYTEVNGVAGSFPGGDTFEADYPGEQFVIENSTLLMNDYPEWGSGVNTLTFGNAYIAGDNLSLGGFSRATMVFDAPVNGVSFEMVYYENGPWGGIEFHLDGIRNGKVVASDVITIADGGGRDNLKFDRMSIEGVEVDSVKIYAWYNGGYSAPRLMIDDLTLIPIGTTCAADFNGDDAVNSQDFFDFLTAFFAADTASDFNEDGAVNSQDFFDFLTAFFAGC